LVEKLCVVKSDYIFLFLIQSTIIKNDLELSLRIYTILNDRKRPKDNTFGMALNKIKL